jgi:hypothetical protein
MNAQPSGWYPDPSDASQLRYWDGAAWTAHRAPRHAPTRPSAPSNVTAPVSYVGTPSGPTGKWYFIITIFSCGLLAAVPFFHAASRLDRPQLRKVGAAMGVGGLVGYVLIGLAPVDNSGSPTGALSSIAASIVLVVMVVSCLLLIGLKREVYEGAQRPAPTVAPPAPNESAMARVQEARRKRDEARRLAARDPLMARELGIGRPQSTREYDDGGLLDLNLASVQELSAYFGLPPAVAAEVVTSREALGRFMNLEDAIVFGQISEEHAVVVRDRGIVIAER